MNLSIFLKNDFSHLYKAVRYSQRRTPITIGVPFNASSSEVHIEKQNR